MRFCKRQIFEGGRDGRGSGGAREVDEEGEGGMDGVRGSGGSREGGKREWRTEGGSEGDGGDAKFSDFPLHFSKILLVIKF